MTQGPTTPEQYKLGQVIRVLELADCGDWTLPYGFTNPHSYRGYYEDVAFQLTVDVTVQECLDAARSALGTAYEGWKGGDYVMDAFTDVWIVGDTGQAGGETLGRFMLDLMLSAAHTQPPITKCSCKDDTTPCLKHPGADYYPPGLT
jgi:hypothetical protein